MSAAAEEEASVTALVKMADTCVGACPEGALADNIGLIEMCEAEGDAGIVTEAEAALNALGTKINAIFTILKNHGLMASS